MVCNGKRTYQHKKNTFTRVILCKRRADKMAIDKAIIRKLDRRIQILRKICQWKNNKLCIKTHDKKGWRQSWLYINSTMQQRAWSKLCKRKQLKHRWNKEKTIVTYKAHNGQDLPLPRYYKTTIYTDDQRQLLWLYAEDKGWNG